MHSSKNKFIYFILLLLISSFALPFYSYGTDTSYVWSEVSSPIVTTSSVLSEGERKFFKSYLW